jgi:hypothetical protein
VDGDSLKEIFPLRGAVRENTKRQEADRAALGEAKGVVDR